MRSPTFEHVLFLPLLAWLSTYMAIPEPATPPTLSLFRGTAEYMQYSILSSHRQSSPVRLASALDGTPKGPCAYTSD